MIHRHVLSLAERSKWLTHHHESAKYDSFLPPMFAICYTHCFSGNRLESFSFSTTIWRSQ